MDANSTNPQPPSAFRLLLWTGLWMLMWFWAIVGPLFVVLAVLSFFVDVSGFASMTLFGGEPVRTPQQKAAFLTVGLGLSIVGIGFLWLVRRGTIKEPV